jgi:hypothetical protein
MKVTSDQLKDTRVDVWISALSNAKRASSLNILESWTHVLNGQMYAMSVSDSQSRRAAPQGSYGRITDRQKNYLPL